MTKTPNQSADTKTSPTRARVAWVKPAITRIEAGSAENGAGSRSDNAITFS